ncbi:3-hydroxybenzoate synthase [bioreactor metagenome]|uniref:3-hydroxybenzoate synthase n=1 Tax=bioreactor metagenome TaxID=1076179 RepID=A0A645IRG1_9ZZZZ
MNNQNVTLQTRNTLENIKYLISDINLSENGIRGKISTPSLLRVYVKHKKDFTTVEAEILKLWPETPAIYLEADICREELLVEIEGIAMLHENANMC